MRFIKLVKATYDNKKKELAKSTKIEFSYINISFNLSYHQLYIG